MMMARSWDSGASQHAWVHDVDPAGAMRNVLPHFTVFYHFGTWKMALLGSSLDLIAACATTAWAFI